MQDLKNKLEQIQRKKYNKLRERFIKNLKSGGFSRKTYREKNRIVNTLKALERKLGIAFSPKLRHWALALSLGVVTLVVHAGEHTKKGPFANRPKREMNRRTMVRNKSMFHLKSTMAEGDTMNFELTGIGNSMPIDNQLADFDGDGDIDLITFDYYGGYNIFFNDGTGQMILGQKKHENDFDAYPFVNDFDNDGDYDFMIQTYDYMAEQYNTVFYENDGSGNFSTKDISFPKDFYEYTHMIDVNNDGHIDFVSRIEIGGSDDYEAGLFINDGNMNFTYQSLGFDASIYAIGYFNNDALPDLLTHTDYYISGQSGIFDSIYIYINESESFSKDNKVGSTIEKLKISELIDTVDVNNDGINEVITIKRNWLVTHDSIYILHCDENAVFDSIELIFDTTFITEHMDVTDIDADGDLDIALYQYNYYDFDSTKYSMTVLYKNDANGFTRKNVPNVEDIFEWDAGFDLVDIDEDGDLDLIANNYYYGLGSWENDGDENFTSLNKYIVDPFVSLEGLMVDFDNDSDLDIVTSGVGHIIRNDGDGTFVPFLNLYEEIGSVNYNIIAGDMDNDGDQDLILDRWKYSDSVFIEIWSYESGAIQVQGSLSIHDNEMPEGLTVGNLDDDNYMDIALLTENYFGTYKNLGSSTFSTLNIQKSFEEEDFVSFVLADVDNNNVPDAIFSTYDTLYIIKNDGMGNFSTLESHSLDDAGIDIACFAVGDIDGDSDLDIVIADYEAYDRIFENNGDGNFSLNTSEIPSEYSYINALGDLDNDGDLDLIVSHYNFPTAIYSNDGDGNFIKVKDLNSDVMTYSYDIVTGDVDGDGDIDIFQPTLYNLDNLWINQLITEKEENEAPTDITLSSNSIDENEPVNSTVGNFSATDANTGDTHTYSLIAGNGTNDADNASFTIDGSALKTNATFDYETKNEYRIYVQANDGKGGTYAKAFVINVKDVNEGPGSITDFTKKIKVDIYPNPSNGLVTIKSSQVFSNIEIFNMDGKSVYRNTFKNTEKIKLDQGVYFVRLISNDIIVNRKVVVE